MGEQVEPAASGVPLHEAGTTEVQVPLAAQQARGGCGQGLGEQVDPEA